MPEGHSIHRLARVLTELFAGEVLSASSPQGRFSDGAALLSGKRLLPAQAWGKHLFVPFAPETTTATASLTEPASNILWLHVHLGLYGRFVFDGGESFRTSTLLGVPHMLIGEGDPVASTQNSGNDTHVGWVLPEAKGAVRLRLVGSDGVADLSGPNQCEVLTGAEIAPILARLGPDPLRNEAGDRARFVELTRARTVAIGQLVLDQSVAAGPGNIYRAESLFRVGINPYRLGAHTSARRLGNLWDDLVELMNAGLETGTIWTVPDDLRAVDPPEWDLESARWAVYHRTNRPCLRCGAPIREADMQGRRLFWCGSCQR